METLVSEDDDTVIQLLQSNIELISSNLNGGLTTTQIQQAEDEIHQYLQSTPPKTYTNVLLESLHNPTKSDEFKQFIINVFSNIIQTEEDWEALPDETQMNLKSSLLAGYWSQNEKTGLLTVWAEFVIKIYTKFGEDNENKMDSSILTSETQQVLNTIDETLLKSDLADCKLHFKSLILYKAFVDNLSCISGKMFEEYAKKLDKFLNTKNLGSGLQLNCTKLAIEIAEILLSNFISLSPVETHFKLYRCILSWIHVFNYQQYYDGLQSCLNILYEGIDKIDSYGVEINNLMDTLINNQGQTLIRNPQAPPETRVGVINLILKMLQTGKVGQIHIETLLEVATGLLIEAINKEALEIITAFELEALPANGFLPISCKLIELLVKSGTSNSNYSSMVNFAADKIKGDAYEQSAALLILGLVAQSQKELILNELSHYMNIIMNVFGTTNPLVKSCGTFALIQASIHLLPGILAYSTEITPFLLDYLECSLSNTEVNGQCKFLVSFHRTQEALINFMNERYMREHLMGFLKKIFALTQKSVSPQLRCYSLDIINTFAKHGEEIMKPNVDEIFNFVKTIKINAESGVGLASNNKNDIVEIVIKCFDVMNTLVKEYNCSDEHHQYLLSTCTSYLQTPQTDLEIIQSVYRIIIEMAKVKKGEMTDGQIQFLVNHMLNSLKQDMEFTDTKSNNNNNGENNGLSGLEEDMSRVSVEGNRAPSTDIAMDYMNEEDVLFETNTENMDKIGLGSEINVQVNLVTNKINIMNMLVQLQRIVGIRFKQVLTNVNNVINSFEYSQSNDLKVAAVNAQTNFFMFDFATADKTQRTALAKSIGLTIQGIIKNFQEHFSESGQFEIRKVYLNFIRYGFQCGGKEVIAQTPELKEQIQDLLTETIKDKRNYYHWITTSSPEEFEDEEFIQVCEYFDVIIKTLKYFGMSMIGEDFISYFSTLVGFMAIKLYGLQGEVPGFNDKLFVLGLASDMVGVFGKAITPVLSETLINWFVKYSSDPQIPIQRTAIYGLGEVALVSGDSNPSLLKIYNCLGQINSKEPQILDNLMAAFAKVLIACPISIAANHVLPVLISYLPLKSDLLEYESILLCFATLMSDAETRPRIFGAYVKPLLHTIKHVFDNQALLIQLEDDSESDRIFCYGSQLMKLLRRHFPKDFTAALGSISLREQNILLRATGVYGPKVKS